MTCMAPLPTVEGASCREDAFVEGSEVGKWYMSATESLPRNPYHAVDYRHSSWQAGFQHGYQMAYDEWWKLR